MTKKMKFKIGDKLKSECDSCGEDEIWQVESTGMEDYSDGVFRTYELRAIKNCISNSARITVKDVPEAYLEFEIIKQ
jgi:hypothetical protein